MNGEYIVDPVHGLWTGGVVSPGAAVSLNRRGLVVGPSLVEIGWWGWGPWGPSPHLDQDSWTPELAQGRNTLRFEAVFGDGETINVIRTVIYDPTLTQRASQFLSVNDNDPATVRLVVGTYERIDYPDDAADIGDSETVDVAVADDAVFKMLSANGWIHHGYDFDGLVDLLAFIDDGNCLPCDPNVESGTNPNIQCPDRCIWTSWGYYDDEGVQRPGSYGYLGISLFNTNGELQQFTQAYDP